MSWKAVAWGSLTVLCWAIGAIFDKLALNALPPKVVFVARLYIAFILFLTPMVLAWEPTREAVFRAERRAVLYLIASVVFTYAGLYVYFEALSGSYASRVVPYCAAYPLLAFLLAMAFLKEPFSATAFIGALMVTAGAYLLSRS